MLFCDRRNSYEWALMQLSAWHFQQQIGASEKKQTTLNFRYEITSNFITHFLFKSNLMLCYRTVNSNPSYRQHSWRSHTEITYIEKRLPVAGLHVFIMHATDTSWNESVSERTQCFLRIKLTFYRHVVPACSYTKLLNVFPSDLVLWSTGPTENCPQNLNFIRVGSI
jgi:hypothetical protein